MYSNSENDTTALLNHTLQFRSELEVLADNTKNQHVSAFIYNTALDSDGGFWTEKPAPSFIRSAGQGRNNNINFPQLSCIMATASSVVIKDLSDSKQTIWLEIKYSANGLLAHRNVRKVCALNGYLFILCSYHLYILDLIQDKVHVIGISNSYNREGPGIGYANVETWENTFIYGSEGGYRLPSYTMNTIKLSITPLSVVEDRGLPTPTAVLMSTNGKLCVINANTQNNIWDVSTWSDTSWTYGSVADITPSGLLIFAAGTSKEAQNLHLVYITNKNYRAGSTDGLNDVDYVLSNIQEEISLMDREIVDITASDNSITVLTPNNMYILALDDGNVMASRITTRSSKHLGGWRVGWCTLSLFDHIQLLDSTNNNIVYTVGNPEYKALSPKSVVKSYVGPTAKNYVWCKVKHQLSNQNWTIRLIISGVVSPSGAEIGMLNQTLIEMAYWNNEKYLGAGLRVFIDEDRYLRCELTTDGFVTHTITPVSASCKISPKKGQHVAVVRHNNAIHLLINGNIVSSVDFTANLYNANAKWIFGCRWNGLHAAHQTVMTILNVSIRTRFRHRIWHAVSYEEMSLLNSSKEIDGSGFVKTFYDPMRSASQVFTKTNLISMVGMEVVDSIPLSDFGITGNLLDVHAVNDKFIAITDTKVFAWFNETLFDRAKSDYLDAKNAKIVNSGPLVGFTVDSSWKQMLYGKVKPGTMRSISIFWTCVGENIPYKNGSSIAGTFGSGTITALICCRSNGTLNLMPDYADTNPDRWTIATSTNNYSSDAGITARLKLSSDGWYIEVQGNSSRLVWKIEVMENEEREVKPATIHEKHVPHFDSPSDLGRWATRFTTPNLNDRDGRE